MRLRRHARVTACLLALLAQAALAQTTQPAGLPAATGQDLDLRYVGAGTRLGIGYDSQNKLRGDAFHVFGETERSAWIGELWFADRGAGGGQLSYHWRPAAAEPGSGVRKLFAAIDQNSSHDRKITLGGGVETEPWFVSGYASAAITGRRQLGVDEVTTMQTISGDDGRPFEQDIFTTTRTTLFERAYDYGVGVRAGHFFEAPLVRVQMGFDYERGQGNASQSTVSLGVEKYFAGTPHSIALIAEAYHKNGDLEPTRNDQRVTAMYRYEFGSNSYRPAREYRDVRVETPAPVASPPLVPPTAAEPPRPRIEKRLVKTTASMASDAFFDFDKAVLRPDARAALEETLARLKASGYEGNIRITGHTCNIGTAAYNQKLSERRAAAVRRFLIEGGMPADRLLAEGMGLANPRYPNDREGRPKNRRVDIEFVAYETRTEEVTLPPEPPHAASPAPVVATPSAPAVEWRREYIDSEPSWVRRALHNPAQHKQSVDVYRMQQQTSTVVAGDKRYLNRGPNAVNDAFTVNGNSTANALDVLPNDSDPDGDAISIVAVGMAAHGTAQINGSRLSYTPTPGYTGPDTFTYTIADPKGLTSTATVSISVTAVNHPPIAQPDFATAGKNKPVAIAVLANDSDPDGDALTIVSFTQPARGTVTRGENNTLVYLSFKDYVGVDTFIYTISDGRGGIAGTTVTVYADP